MKESTVGGKFALVVGAGNGIGRATAVELARGGAKLALMDINGDALQAVAGELEAQGTEVSLFTADATDPVQVGAVYREVISGIGPPDILINCVGIAHMAHLVEMAFEDWERLVSVNLYSMVNTVNAFAPTMMERGSGSIVNIASAQSFFAVPTWGAYACTKYAVEGFSEALRFEMHRYGVRVITVFPGIVRTPFYAGITGGRVVRLGMKVLMATAMKPETMARLIVKGIKKKKKMVIPSVIWPIYLMRRVVPWPFESAGRAIAFLLKAE